MRASRLAHAGKVLPLLLALAAGCKDANGPPGTGTIRVSLTTTGFDIDPDGYAVRLDGGPARNVGANGSVTISGVEPGTRTVRLVGFATNCSVAGGAERTLTVAAGGEATATFAVSCVARVGSIRVTTVTSGSEIDPDGYTVEIDEGCSPWDYGCDPASIETQGIGVNGTLTLADLREGSHAVTLGNVAANCRVVGSNPVQVEVSFGGTASADFAVMCGPTSSTPTAPGS
jgi:hypothetical protein